jgi:hypothetical protein
MTKNGRRLIFDEATQEEIAAIIGRGGSLTAAARQIGCSRSTIRRAAERDAAFAKRLARAKSRAEMGLIDNVNKAAQKEQYWRAAAWALERFFPESYAARSGDALTVEQLDLLLGKFAEIVVEEVPERYRTKILKKMDAEARKLGIDLKPEATDGPP